MPRALPEWIGRTPDTQVPQRVKVRVFQRAGGRCQKCTRKIAAGDTWECDHKDALVNGGENRERNLQILCGWCHGAKTREDVAEKSDNYRRYSKHIGAYPKSKRSLTDPNWKRKVDGTTVRR